MTKIFTHFADPGEVKHELIQFCVIIGRLSLSLSTKGLHHT